MPNSYPDGRPAVRRAIHAMWPLRDDRGRLMALDVGVGSGEGGKLLAEEGFELENVHGLEIYAPYIVQFAKDLEYGTIISGKVDGDVREFIRFNTFVYDLVLMGDVLEHLTVVEASKVLKHFAHHSRLLLVSVPWHYPQGAVGGNEFEAHQQDDLTLELMQLRYGEWLVPIWKNERVGVFEGGLRR